jgi:hypothetical protein
MMTTPTYKTLLEGPPRLSPMRRRPASRLSDPKPSAHQTIHRPMALPSAMPARLARRRQRCITLYTFEGVMFPTAHSTRSLTFLCEFNGGRGTFDILSVLIDNRYGLWSLPLLVTFLFHWKTVSSREEMTLKRILNHNSKAGIAQRNARSLAIDQVAGKSTVSVTKRRIRTGVKEDPFILECNVRVVLQNNSASTRGLVSYIGRKIELTSSVCDSLATSVTKSIVAPNVLKS